MLVTLSVDDTVKNIKHFVAETCKILRKIHDTILIRVRIGRDDWGLRCLGGCGAAVIDI